MLDKNKVIENTRKGHQMVTDWVPKITMTVAYKALKSPGEVSWQHNRNWYII